MLVVPPSAQTVEEWRPGVRTLLRVSAATGARELCVMEQWHDPGCGAPAHVHGGVEEVIVVVAGSAEFWIEGERALLEAGSAVVVPADSRHGFRNAGDGVLHIVATFASAAPPVEYVDDPGPLAIGARADAPHRTAGSRDA